MKIYLAARYRHLPELLERAIELVQAGHEVTSRWIYGGYDDSPDNIRATDDIADVERADTLIFFSEPVGQADRGGGGRHVEFGLALSLGKQLIVIGGPENLYHSLPGVAVASDWGDAKRIIERQQGAV